MNMVKDVFASSYLSGVTWLWIQLNCSCVAHEHDNNDRDK